MLEQAMEQEQSDGAVEEPERVADVADDGFFEGWALDGEVGVGLGELLAEAAWTVARSAWAWATETPGLMRPMTVNQVASRRCA